MGALHAAAFLSGGAALLCELVWVRRLGEVFGTTAPALQVVLAVFFLGLGLGARVGGRWLDRALRPWLWYGALEGVIALSALLFLPLVAGLDQVLVQLAPAELGGPAALVWRSVGAAALLAAPTLAMGATLPALVRAAAPAAVRARRSVPGLYGANTLGAALGAASAAFLWLPVLGLAGTLQVAAAGNGLAALLVVVGARRHAVRDLPAVAAATGPATAARSWRGLAFLSGLLTVGCEVLWQRLLAVRTAGTIDSGGLALSAFLLALGGGALLAGWLVRAGRTPRTACGVCLLAGGVLVLASPHLPWPVLPAVRTQPFLWWREALAALVLVGLPGVLLGVWFPLVAVQASGERVAGDLGRVYWANTLGSVLAPLLFAFVLMPALGLARSFAAASAAVLLAGLWCCVPRLLPCLLAALPLLLLVAFWPVDLRSGRDRPEDRVLAAVEGVAASVAVIECQNGDRLLKVDQEYRLGARSGRFPQQRQGVMPLLLHPDPRRVLMLGLGTGGSAGVVARLGGVQLDVLEVLPEVIAMLPWFADSSDDLHRRVAQDPALRLLPVDARHFVRATPRRYDVVVGDLFLPWRSGEAAMHSAEHFAAVREVLADGGLFCQWLACYQLGIEDLRSITGTFFDVFPDGCALLLHLDAHTPTLGLVGSRGPVPVARARIERALQQPEWRAALQAVGLERPEGLEACVLAARPVWVDWARGAVRETRDRPRVEFRAPRGAVGTEAGAAVLAALLAVAGATPPFSVPEPAALAIGARHRVAAFRLLRGQLERAPLAAARQLAHGLAAAPEWGWLAAQLSETLLAAARDDGAAAAALAEELQQQPRTAAWGHVFRGELARATGDVARMRREAEAALALMPQLPAARVLLELATRTR